jgi:hypothetical protein
VISVLANQVMYGFERHVLRVCRGNLEDINQGVIFNCFMEQHNIEEAQFYSNLIERM